VVIISRGRLVADAPVAELAARAAGETVIRAEFEGAVDTGKLAKLPGVRGAETAPDGAILLRTAPGTDPRAAISRLAAQEGWVLLGLRQEQQSLEEVFGELTK
jgi:ABC-2 type transport system ATP-binding protein